MSAGSHPDRRQAWEATVLDFGQTVTGVVLVDDGQSNRQAQPRRTATGAVTGIEVNSRNVARIQTDDGEHLLIRVSR